MLAGSIIMKKKPTIGEDGSFHLYLTLTVEIRPFVGSIGKTDDNNLSDLTSIEALAYPNLSLLTTDSS